MSAILPLAKLSAGLSLLLSQLQQFAALALALRKLAPDKSYLFFLIGAVLAPAASNNVLAGSNAVLVAARPEHIELNTSLNGVGPNVWRGRVEAAHPAPKRSVVH